ncbi:DUF5106 domain-containing protein [Mucilaginibacter lappiensis]|nr:DUF5106 domain-containing protein [Mucilaginibacter lappiensis]
MFFLSCHGAKEKKQVNKNEIMDTQPSPNPVTQNPIKMKAKQIYQLSHYWDKFNFADSLDNTQSGFTEQAFVNYITLFPSVPLNEVQNSIDSFMDRAKTRKKTFVFFENLFDKYLYNPNSPLRNDLFYEPVLRYLLKSDMINDTERIRYQIQLRVLQKNKPGSKAKSFSYWLGRGKLGCLAEIEAPFTLLIFYEPGCSACEQLISQVKASLSINDLINKKILKVLAIYPEGNEEIWKGYQTNIPANWINGLDREQHVLKGRIYDLKASPTIYLLDENKIVLLKDVDFLQVGKFFESLNNRGN